MIFNDLSPDFFAHHFCLGIQTYTPFSHIK